MSLNISLGNEYQKFNKVFNNYCGKMGKTVWKRDLIMAFGMGTLVRGRRGSDGLVSLMWGLLPSVEH